MYHIIHICVRTGYEVGLGLRNILSSHREPCRVGERNFASEQGVRGSCRVYRGYIIYNYILKFM
jgi:hypothetical protein